MYVKPIKGRSVRCPVKGSPCLKQGKKSQIIFIGVRGLTMAMLSLLYKNLRRKSMTVPFSRVQIIYVRHFSILNLIIRWPTVQRRLSAL